MGSSEKISLFNFLGGKRLVWKSMGIYLVYSSLYLEEFWTECQNISHIYNQRVSKGIFLCGMNICQKLHRAHDKKSEKGASFGGSEYEGDRILLVAFVRLIFSLLLVMYITSGIAFKYNIVFKCLYL